MLSNGHASVLQYIALHLTGYGVGIDDLKQQRQWGSITPGHPEHFLTPGIEVTTGPLGQGVGNAVGFAIAERFLADRYNRAGHQVVDHRTWAFCSDGDMMEGVSSEASSLAGYLRLGKLTLLYDDNHITIDGRTEITFGEDVEARYRAYGWHTLAVEDANDTEALAAAYQAAVDEPDRPTFIRLRSHIAWGAPNAQDTPKAHGAALGEDEVRATKQAYGWDPDKHFVVPDGVYDRWRVKVPDNQAARADWERRLEAYAGAEPELAAELRAGIAGELPDGWDAELDKLFAEPKKLATRSASQACINAIAQRLPTFVGGSADLAESNKTDIKDGGSMGPEEVGRNLHYGIREHAMGSISNGLALHGGLRPFCGHLPGLLRLHAAQRAPGQPDGPAGGVRLDPRLDRAGRRRAHPPAGRAPGVAAGHAPAAGHPPGRRAGDGRGLAGGHRPHRRPHRPGPVPPGPAPDRPGGPRRRRGPAPGRLRAGRGRRRRAAAGPDRHRLGGVGGAGGPRAAPGRRCPDPGGVDALLGAVRGPGPGATATRCCPQAVPARLAVEAAASFGWSRWVGDHGEVVSRDDFGASAPGELVLEKFGFTPDNVADRARALLGRLEAKD